MARPNKDEFRITTFPERRLPHPPVPRWDYELKGDVLVPSDREPTTATDDTTGEIYLRLRALDLSDERKILAFVNAYGILGVRAGRFAGLPGTHAPLQLRRRMAKSEQARKRARRRRTTSVPASAWSDSLPRAETLAEFRLGADWLADLTSLWLNSRHDLLSLDDWRIVDPEWFGGEPESAAMRLEQGLEAALRPFYPRVMVADPKLADSSRDVATRWSAVRLFGICALELFNHISEAAPYRRCANERCERLFVRQEGRARFGQHRTEGVRFCSERCLRAQKQRDYRKRKARV